ncbi:MAG: glycosyltransferase family 2 protein [Microcystaceae cyanobacterium]
MQSSSVLSICIPAYNRPDWLKRALTSITVANSEVWQIEIIVSDDSSNPACAEVAQEILENWCGKWQYLANQPRLGMAENWNHSIQVASGEYVLVLHDDDFLYAGVAGNILKAISRYRKQHPILLFSVQVVNEKERVLKKQTFKNLQYLPPQKALINLLSNSSFVRFPAIVIQRRVFEEVGYFNPALGEPTDIDMWIRLFSRYGVLCLPFTTCAYTVHSQALTMGAFHEKTVGTLLEFFDQVSNLNLLNSSELRVCKARFFHQFILAGTYRKMRQGNLSDACASIQLFKIPDLANLKIPMKWLMIRRLFEIILRGYCCFNCLSR